MGFKDMLLRLPPVTKNLLIINIIIWIAMAMVRPVSALLESYGALYYFTSDQFLPWQLLSYMFIHANFTHLLFNMWALFMFGVMMERVLGSAKFLFYYISCGLGAALIQEGVFALMINHYAGLFNDPAAICRLLSHSQVTNYDLIDMGINPVDPAVYSLFGLYHTPTIGASGAIFGILLAYGFMFPNMRIYMIIPPMPIKARTFVIVYAIIELALGVYNSQADTVAHFAHLGGMVAGLLILIYWKKKGVIGGPTCKPLNCRRLIYINIAVYVALKLLWLLLPDVPADFEAVLQWIALPASAADALPRPWTLLSYSFVQVDFIHLLVNMLWLGWFGTILSGLRGNRAVTALYLGGAAAGACGFLLQSAICGTDSYGVLAGASAATAAITVATTAIAPRYRVRLLFLGEIPLIFVAPIALISFFSGATATVAAHIGGIAAGAAAAVIWRRRARANTEKVRQHLKRLSRKQALLDKARSSGYGSLSETERLELFNLTDNN